MEDDNQQDSVASNAIEDVDLSIIRQMSVDSGIVDCEEKPVTTLSRILDTEDDMSEEEDCTNKIFEKWVEINKSSFQVWKVFALEIEFIR